MEDDASLLNIAWPPGTVLSRIPFAAAPNPLAQEALARFESRYGNVPLGDAEVVVCLGGDGFMLEPLQTVLLAGPPRYGSNCGSVGILMNPMI